MGEEARYLQQCRILEDFIGRKIFLSWKCMGVKNTDTWKTEEAFMRDMMKGS
jgi:hypothetical protein